MSTHPALPEMRSLAAAGDEDGVLRLLLRVWDEERPASIAAAIEALSPRFLFRCKPLVALQPWLMEARARDPLRVTALLAAPGEGEVRRVRRKKLEALEAFPPDPRIAAFASGIFRGLSPGRGEGRREFYGLVARVRARHGVPGEGAADTPEHAALAQAAMDLAPSLEQQLLAAVYASPRDDGPRHVYIDYLLSLGHPLAPHLARQAHTHLPQLLDAWWKRRLLGDEGPDAVELRWGFPHKASLQWRGRPQVTPAWATLEELEIARLEPEWLSQLSLPELSVLTLRPWTGEAPQSLPLLPGLRVKTLGLPWSWWRPVAPEQLSSWSRLETLRLFDTDDTLRLDEASLGALAGRPLSIEVLHAR